MPPSSHRPPEGASTIPALEERHAAEVRALLVSALERSGGKMLPAGRELGISEARMRRLVDKHELEHLATAERGRPPGKAAEP